MQNVLSDTSKKSQHKEVELQEKIDSHYKYYDPLNITRSIGAKVGKQILEEIKEKFVDTKNNIEWEDCKKSIQSSVKKDPKVNQR